MPVLNWVSLPATQVSGTIFNSIDDEKILNSLDFTSFEEKFKLVSGGASGTVRTKGSPSSQAKSAVTSSLGGAGGRSLEASLLEPKRLQNVAIARRKVSAPTDTIKQQIYG